MRNFLQLRGEAHRLNFLLGDLGIFGLGGLLDITVGKCYEYF